MKMVKRLSTIAAITTSLFSIDIIAAPTIIIKGQNGRHQSYTAQLLPSAVKTVIDEQTNKHPDLLKIIVYPSRNHYVLYLLSGKSWSANKITVNLNKAIGADSPNAAGDDDGSNSPDEEKTGICPDDNVQFVVISAYPGVSDVDQAIKRVSEAVSKKYKTMTILSESADGQTYRNWLSCPNLKGFYSIGHGGNEGLAVGNGDIVSSSFFANPAFINKYKNTTLIINSCQIYNAPFGSQLIFGNAETDSAYRVNPGPAVYEFVGGYSDLVFGSELSSACFVENAINGSTMDFETLKQCIGSSDIHYQSFAIAYPGRKFDL